MKCFLKGFYSMMHTCDEDDEREGRHRYNNDQPHEGLSHWKPAYGYRLHGYVRSGERQSPPESLTALDSRIESEDGKETFSFNRPIKWLK
jgi:hypothetical protein